MAMALGRDVGRNAFTCSTDDMDTGDSLDRARDTVCFSRRITPAQYKDESVQYTQQAVRALRGSPEYKQHVQRCKSCGSSWFHGMWTDGCKECGGFPMERPCCICKGKCHAVWSRNIGMSHAVGEAHWDGRCLLSVEEQQAYFLRNVVRMDEDDELVMAMEDLATTTQ